MMVLYDKISRRIFWNQRTLEGRDNENLLATIGIRDWTLSNCDVPLNIKTRSFTYV